MRIDARFESSLATKNYILSDRKAAWKDSNLPYFASAFTNGPKCPKIWTATISNCLVNSEICDTRINLDNDTVIKLVQYMAMELSWGCLPGLWVCTHSLMPWGQLCPNRCSIYRVRYWWLMSRFISLSTSCTFHVQDSHASPALKFPDFFLTNSQFLLSFCSMKIWYFHLCRNSHGSHKCMKSDCGDHLAKKKYGLSSLCAKQINYCSIYKMSKYYKKYISRFSRI